MQSSLSTKPIWPSVFLSRGSKLEAWRFFNLPWRLDVPKALTPKLKITKEDKIVQRFKVTLNPFPTKNFLNLQIEMYLNTLITVPKKNGSHRACFWVITTQIKLKLGVFVTGYGIAMVTFYVENTTILNTITCSLMDTGINFLRNCGSPSVGEWKRMFVLILIRQSIGAGKCW